MSFVFTHPALERPAILLPAALLLLGAAAALLWTQARRAPVRAAAIAAPMAASPDILVSAADIARGQMLTGREFILKPAGPQTPPDTLHRAEDAQDHLALVAIAAGQPLRAGQVSATAARGIAAHVPEGYRAYALPVSEAASAGGFVQAGDHVDLYVTLPGALFGESAAADRRGDRSKSTLLLRDVTVLATGTKTESDGKPDTSLRTITLALKANALASVSLASRLGAISFAIRNPLDVQAQPSAPAGLATLMAGAATAAMPSPQVASRHVVGARIVPLLAGRRSLTLALPGGQP